MEGVDVKTILAAFEKAGVTASQNEKRSDITKYTLYELGLSGGKNSSELRERLQVSLGLPRLLSSSALVEVLCTMMDSAGLAEAVRKVKEGSDDI